ncbi:ATP-binding cassette domain-containing protein [Candidatus Berkelbacteria bacterium]|nr:ATP-binding cassette domain-containing protein [Candidatus Berkelbacteria bacterium]
MTDPIILKNTSKSYDPKTWAVQHVNLRVHAGEFFCIVGPSGCGKSTLLKLIANLEEPTEGKIEASNRTAMVFQSGALLPWLTARDNVGLGLTMQGLPRERVTRAATRYLAMVGLKPFGSRFPRELSGGQRQRVGIARALAIEPEVLLLDEPFSSLDQMTTEELHRDLLGIWQQNRLTIVMVSHLLDEALLLADRIAIMRQGTMNTIVPVQIGRPRDPHGQPFITQLKRLKHLIASTK